MRYYCFLYNKPKPPYCFRVSDDDLESLACIWSMDDGKGGGNAVQSHLMSRLVRMAYIDQP